ncbi:MAG: GNAT family N-acetyltransferase [Bacillota bacterium]|nr:GNAT family N-acetyltransferase [Bacillota bacterium]
MINKETMQWKREGFTISTNKSYLDTETIYQFLTTESYWAKGIAKELVIASIDNSTLCYGIYIGDPSNGDAKLIGFARVVSDLVRFAWLGDVFILPDYRGRGLSKWLMEVIVEHPKLRGTSFNLGTDDAHSLYEKFGFKPIDKIEKRLARPLNWEDIYSGYQLTKN